MEYRLVSKQKKILKIFELSLMWIGKVTHTDALTNLLGSGIAVPARS